MNILLIAGELSGDMFGAALGQEIKHLQPEVTIFSYGGPRLRQISQHFLLETIFFSAIGVWEKVCFYREVCHFKRHLKQFLKKQQIEQAVLIDFPHYNIAIAKILHQRQIPITTYITPHFWIWGNTKQAQQIIKYSQRIITIFKQEYAFYQKLAPQQTFYFGHPLPQLLATAPAHQNPAPTSDQELIIGLLPGSRQQEIQLLWPVMARVCQLMHRQDSRLKFRLALSSEHFLPLIQKIIKQQNLYFVEICPRTEVFATANLLISATGTANLEAVLANLPVITLGALHPWTYFLVRYFWRLQIPFIALPNIIAGQEIVPEFAQAALVPEDIAQAASHLLTPAGRAALLNKYSVVTQLLTKSPKPLRDAAEIILAKTGCAAQCHRIL